METQLFDTLRNLAQYSGNFVDAAAAARLAAPLCKLDTNGNVIAADARSSVATVFQAISAQYPEVAKAAPQAPARGSLVNDPGVLALLAEDRNEQKVLETLRGLFGRGSSAVRASALMRSNADEYRRLRALAVAANLL